MDSEERAQADVFRYTLVDADGEVIGSHQSPRALHVDDAFTSAGSGTAWQVVSVVGLMATVVPVTGRAAGAAGIEPATSSA